MLKSILLIFFLLLYASPAFTQELLEDKKTGKLYHKTKNAAGEWMITEYPTRREPVGAAQPGAQMKGGATPQSKGASLIGSTPSTSDSPIGYSPTGKPIYRGPRGGEYHRSESEGKVYHPRGSSSSGRSSSGGGGRGGRR